ncbi:MAG: uracil-DNA glycosylase [Gammaproteobacteria bacterium]|nr:MAG: uracil-DNA glycosylase [Gammaproteobacteria bacterium]
MTDWTSLLKEQKESPHFKSVMQFVADRRQQGVTIYPPIDKVFEAFRLTAFADIKVVILGQDPYHGAGQAHGLCFSVGKEIPPPPSLKNIYKEMQSDLGLSPAKHGFLQSWAQQGVFLLNTVLTVEAAQANSHRGKGWEEFTDEVIRIISSHADHVVFLLWGSPAQKKATLIDGDKHTILTSVHPSPLSAYRGFLGCKHFSKTNEALKAHHQTAINWAIDD